MIKNTNCTLQVFSFYTAKALIAKFEKIATIHHL